MIRLYDCISCLSYPGDTIYSLRRSFSTKKNWPERGPQTKKSMYKQFLNNLHMGDSPAAISGSKLSVISLEERTN